MAAPHDTSEADYIDAVAAARRMVAGVYDLTDVGVRVLAGRIQRRYRAVWRINIKGEGLPVQHLFVALPFTFADELPDVYLPEAIVRDGARIPHLDESLQLCTFDDGNAWPNPNEPGEAVIHVIRRAIQIIRDGTAHENGGEYAREFEAYWGDAAKGIEFAVSLLRLEPPHRTVVSMALSHPLGGYRRVLAETEDAAAAFAEAVDRLPQKPVYTKALYLHLDDLGGPPNLVTNADVLRRLPRLAGAEERVLSFLAANDRPSTVVFSIPVNDTRIGAAWVHRQYATEGHRAGKRWRVKGQARGFRPGHLPVETELSSRFGGVPVDHVLLRRADDARMGARTSGGDRGMGAINVIGCGSLGGFIADTVRHRRPAQLRLVDPDILEIHNVPRHVCDLTHVGSNKAAAVRTVLRRFDPHLDVTSSDENVLEILRRDPSTLAGVDYTFVAVAHAPVERRMNRLARSVALGTVVYLWIEPHAVAGHAVIVPPNAPACFECLLDERARPAIQVLADPSSFLREDYGCRGTYTPYAGGDAQRFARAIADEALRGHPETAKIVTWVGDIEAARRNGLQLDPGFSDAAPYTLRVSDAPRRGDCPVCSRR
jgi:hypothetical protein